MTFIMRMAMREIRASWQRLLFFFVCIAIGVGSIVALRSVIQSVRVALAGEARTLLGADVALTTNRPWTDAVLNTLDEETRAGRITVRSEAAEIPTMVRPADPAKVGASTSGATAAADSSSTVIRQSVRGSPGSVRVAEWSRAALSQTTMSPTP